MSKTIDNCFDSCKELLEIVQKEDGPSITNAAQSILQKHFAICVASHFERQLCDAVEEYVTQISNNHSPVISFMKQKAIERQYHTWFDWSGTNANRFFSLFGKEFKDFITERIEAEDLDYPIQCFIELGRDRNVLVHNDLTASSFNMTLDEVCEKYQQAERFVDMFPDVFFAFQKQKASHPEDAELQAFS